jgi:hypothetical protein
VKTKLTGLVPGATYRLRSTVEFLTDVPNGCVGTGGSPGESVWIVIAAATIEPMTVFDGADYRLNIDSGNQGRGGRDGVVLGNIANTVQNCGPRRWESKSLTVPAGATLTVRADERGEAWFLVGLDSGLEASSRIYHQRVLVRLEPL